MYDTGALTVQNTFVDLNSLDNFDSSASWWDKQFNDEVTVNNKLYFTQGKKEEFFAKLGELKSSDIVIDRETLELIRTFQ